MREWTAKEVESRLNENLQMIDVREYEETQSGIIPGAKHIPLGEIPDRLNEIDNTQVLLICRSGARSERAAHFLQKQGYDVVNMTGGMTSWKGKTLKPQQ
ncbi:rhodanese-like domain-containing protein [Alkalicoccus halolimnae]|uniref:Rhodanese-like domain-containing protein n=1 Tax=Alkalicoccus halolimnae TaxID=1667239 RepID=A0A5C7F9R5_9BACI|nr:rhodanese-like domain-containing protein [Alkalicoccus halolimnae]TXF82512.1 rhodanese-like domain-containing protein [Alkalicoccus halolimnae]